MKFHLNSTNFFLFFQIIFTNVCMILIKIPGCIEFYRRKMHSLSVALKKSGTKNQNLGIPQFESLYPGQQEKSRSHFLLIMLLVIISAKNFASNRERALTIFIFCFLKVNNCLCEVLKFFSFPSFSWAYRYIRAVKMCLLQAF